MPALQPCGLANNSLFVRLTKSLFCSILSLYHCGFLSRLPARTCPTLILLASCTQRTAIMPLHDYEKQKRKPKTFWGKVQNVFTNNTPSHHVPTNHRRFVDHASLQALQASQPKKSTGAAGQRLEKSGKKEQGAGLQHPDVQREAADFLSSGAHYGPMRTKSKKVAAHDEALKKLTSSEAPAPTSMRQKVKADYKHYPTPDHGPSLVDDVELYLRRQGSRQYTYTRPSVGAPAPPPKPPKADRGKPPLPVKNLRTVPKYNATLTRLDHKRHVSTAASPVSPLSASTDRATKWEDFYAQVSPVTPLLPPMPTLPNAAKTHQYREELDRKRDLVPRCQLCREKDAVADEQISKLGYSLCKPCAKKAFYYPSTSQASFPQSHETPLPSSSSRRADSLAGSSYDYPPARNPPSPAPPPRRAPKPTHPSPAPSPTPAAFASTPWVTSLRPSPQQNPLNPTLHPLTHTYSTIFALAQSQPAPPVPSLPSSSAISTSTSTSPSHKPHHHQAPKQLRHQSSSTYSLALPPGTLPPSTLDPSKPQAPRAPLPPVLEHQTISTATHLPAPSLPPLGPLPPLPTRSVYEPIAWRSDKRQQVKRKPAPPGVGKGMGMGMGMGVTDATRAAAQNYGVKGPAEAGRRGEEEWRRSSGFYEFWGEILGGG